MTCEPVKTNAESAGPNGMTSFLLSFIDFARNRTFLDLGCGKGKELAAIAKQASLDAVLTGIDVSDRSIATAREANASDERMCFLVHDMELGLPFEDESFDVVFSRNVVECICDKVRFIKELHRVIKPGGSIIISHYDWDTQIFNAKDKCLHRRILHAYNDWQQPWMNTCDAWMGRRLYGMFQASGLFTGDVYPYVLTETQYEEGFRGFSLVRDELVELVAHELIRDEEYQQFNGELSALAASGEYFYSINLYAYVGKSNKG